MSHDVPIPKELWDLIPPAAQAALLAVWVQLRKQGADLQSQVVALQKQVDDLKAQLGQNSSNSSKPPSTDQPRDKDKNKDKNKAGGGRPRGGQTGHPRHLRAPLPPDEFFTIKPAACRGCGQALVGEDPEPLCHQVVELPVIKPHVAEYRLHRLSCPCCGVRTCATLPDGVPRGGQGPRLRAFITLLVGAYRLSKSLVSSLMQDAFNIGVCAGTVCKMEKQTDVILEQVVLPLREHVRTGPVNVDETGWRENRQRAWLWVVVSASITIFHIARSRGGAIARELLGPGFHWVLTSDRYSAYNWALTRRRQVCWAHLARDFQGMVDRGNEGSSIGQELLAFAADVFHWWQRIRDGTLKRSTMRTYIDEQRPWLRERLTRGSECGCAKTSGMCRELLKLEPAMWAFLRHEGVEPTNNAAERALRPAVIWRKTSYGTDSAAGSRFVANVLSVVTTCRQQGKNVLEFLTACCHAHLQAQPLPSLLPA